MYVVLIIDYISAYIEFNTYVLSVTIKRDKNDLFTVM